MKRAGWEDLRYLIIYRVNPMVNNGIFTIRSCRSSEPSTVGGGEFASHLVSLNFTPIFLKGNDAS